MRLVPWLRQIRLPRLHPCMNKECSGRRVHVLRLNGEVNTTKNVCCVMDAEKMALRHKQTLTGESKTCCGTKPVFFIYTSGERHKHNS